MTCVGKTYRRCEEGNKQLAKVGKKVLKLVILDQCYTFRISKSAFLLLYCGEGIADEAQKIRNVSSMT